MPLILKSKPKQYTVEYQDGIFVFDAPNDQQMIHMFEAVKPGSSFATVEPLVKTLLSEVRNVVDQDGNAIIAQQLKGASAMGANLVCALAAKLLTLALTDSEAEQKN